MTVLPATEPVPMSNMVWRPLERPQSAVNLRPGSAGHEEQAAPPPTKLRLLNPLHAGIPTSPDSRIRSVVEALFHVHYHTATSLQYGDPYASDDTAPSMDLHTVEGIRSYLSSEPSLAWAAPYSAQCLRLLRKRAGANHSQAAKMPALSSGARGPTMGMRRSHSAASRLCGGGRLPPMGGGGALCAASLLHHHPTTLPPTWEASAKLAGIEWETAIFLAERLRGLAAEQEGVAAWLLVEICRDCARHSTCFRHEERAFQKRYAQLRAAITKAFAGPVVELLVPADKSSSRHGPPLRIGAFEVFLCCPEPLVPFGAISLPTAAPMEVHAHHADEDADPALAEVDCGAKVAFSAVCISSKLATLRWPQVDATLQRLAAAMPRTALSVRVETAAGFPVPNVRVRASPCEEVFQQEDLGNDRDAARRPGGSRLTIQGQTDVSGCCRLLVPVCVELQLTAWHELLLDVQEHSVVIPCTAKPAEQVFVAETVVQLWQSEEEKELVIYCFSPRAQMCIGAGSKAGGAADAAQQEEFAVRSAFAANPDLQPGMRLRPFQGYLETRSGQILEPDVRGHLRGGPGLLDDIGLIVCDGWRAADVPEGEKAFSMISVMHGFANERTLIEVARLGVPLVEVYIVASCCRAPLPKAHISIDGEPFGATDESGNPISCGVRVGERQIQVQHSLVAEGLTIPVSVADSTTRAIKALMPFRGLHFVCVARKAKGDQTPTRRKPKGDLSPLSPSFRKKGESGPTSADLWLVGGSLAKWKSSSGGPSSGQEVWLWNGEFRGIIAKDGRGFVVESGVITGAALDEEDYEAADGACCLSHAMGKPVSRRGMQAILHPEHGPSGCTMCLMAKMVESQTPALWIARMEGEGGSRRDLRKSRSSLDSGKKGRQLVLRTTCCQRGFLGASATIDEKPAEFRDGVIELPYEGSDTSFRVRLEAIPHCLLPGRSCEYTAHCGPQSPESMDLDIACSLWIYWVPPEEEDEQDEDGNHEMPEGLLWLAANSDHVPEEALPVEGILECPGAEEAVLTFNGSTMGPFTLSPAQGLAVMTQDDGHAPCLLAGLKFQAKPPDGYYHKPREPSPLAERCLELGGCELPRMVNCPVAIGAYKVIQPPPLSLKLRTSCCRCAYAGAHVVLKGHASATIDDSGCVELKRRVDKSCSALQVTVEDVPQCLLPGCSREQEVQCGPFEAASMNLDVSCLIWAYWIPPREEPAEKKEGGPPEEATPGEAERESLLGKLFITVDEEQVPEEACPIVGVLRCAGSEQAVMVLDGKSIGPFRLDAARDMVAGSPAGKPCLLSGLTISVNDMEGLAYHAADPTPLAGSTGCLLQQLAERPLVMGRFSLVDPPPLNLTLHTGCCCRGYPGAHMTLMQHGAAVADGELDENGCGSLPRKRDRSCKELQVQVDRVPNCLLPGGNNIHKLKCKPFAEATMELDIASLLWIYWLPPEEEESDDAPEDVSPQGFLFVTSDKEQVPDEAKPVYGVLLCQGAECPHTVLDGSSLGPFSIRPQRRVRDMLKRKKIVHFKTEDETEEDETSWPMCLLGGIEFHMKAPTGWSYTAKSPSPLLERLQEIGGCELQRLAACPTVVGYFTAIVPPPLGLSFCTACCGRGFVGTRIQLHGGQQKAEATVEEDGHVKLRRRRDPDCNQLELQVDNIPLCLLPSASRKITVGCEPFGAVDLGLDVQCLLWVYWTSPDEDEEEEEAPAEDADGEPPMPPDCMVWVASDVEHVPPEAQCVRGTLMCPGAEPASYAMSGISVGPFQLKRAPKKEEETKEDEERAEEEREDEAKDEEAKEEDEGPPTCLLAGLKLEAEPPEGFSFCARDPSPLADRVAELGGCEMQRLTACPMVIGNFKPIPAQPVQISLRTGCCARGYCGAKIVANGVSMTLDESGVTEISRKRDPKTQTEVTFTVEDVPACLLPRNSPLQVAQGTIYEPLPVPLEVTCNLWIYWVPPEEEEDPDPEAEPQEGMVFIAANEEDLPDEAMPITGVLKVPGTEVPYMEFDGVSKGPFPVRKAGMSTEVPAEEDAECVLSKLDLSVLPPSGYGYRPREPSPFAERCEELGGCELQRVVTCPVVFGFLKPIRDDDS